MSSLLTIIRTGAELATFSLALSFVVTTVGLIGGTVLGLIGGAFFAGLFAPPKVRELGGWLWGIP